MDDCLEKKMNWLGKDYKRVIEHFIHNNGFEFKQKVNCDVLFDLFKKFEGMTEVSTKPCQIKYSMSDFEKKSL